ncbi:hypothetical protein [Rhodospirillum centenum]|uniref:Uncharacterized protein n=1 Tax=Rhodospirillum centenum (strain ATCC 51521 / SW) TaxID=414684 RepID=B6IY06_RHOCS|nr:hypothetical protein [Rhodospirillum centenum]ACJ01180.1 conserved hypothetical protein [Rhodospirillum centenum SW]
MPLKPLLLKETIKLRRLFWVPPLVVLAALVDTWLTLRAFNSMRGPAQLWNALTYKQEITFDSLAYVLPFAGIWYACVQFLPECTGRRLRLMFHLPVSPWLGLYVPVAVGLGLVLLCSVLALGGLAAVAGSLNLPPQLWGPMVETALPWCLAGMVAYLATAATLADPALHRRLVIALAGLAFVTLLTRTTIFAGMSGSLGWYALACLPWLLPLEAAAQRTKESS